jgi:predicted MFS family arabinose efflux permease
MRQRVTLLLGIYAVMALSNAIVPVLPSFAEAAVWLQGAIYSAYFLGAFVTVLPAGILSDKIGRVPLIRIGLICTSISGLLIIFFPSALPVFVARSLEGVGAGLFVAASLSWVNSQPDHRRLSGLYIAALNLGLVTGLLGTGLLDALTGPAGGTVLFTLISVIPLVLSVFLQEAAPLSQKKGNLPLILRSYIWLYLSAVVLVGVTGVVTALYPEYTGATAAALSIQIGAMHTATIVTSLIAPRLTLEPVQTIRIAAVTMGCAVLGCYFTPLIGFFAIMAGFAVIGGVAGFAINAQLTFLAETGVQQGGVMGLFNTSTYAGLTLLPFIAGIVAQLTDFFAAFLVMALLTGAMAVTIGRCACTELPASEDG